MRTDVGYRALLGMLGLVVASCAHPHAPTPLLEGDNLDRLIRLSQRDKRGQWWPAVEQLGRVASADDAIRDQIWTRAKVNTLGMKFVEVKPGIFIQGPDARRPALMAVAHRVEITQGYFMAATEVTNAQFQKLFPERQAPPQSPDPDSPAVNVAWDEADRFCKLLSEREGVLYRLPTEAEWEYACRAGSETLFCFGDDPAALEEYALWNQPRGAAARVASFKPNDWGIYDMHGNALEWVSDWCDGLSLKDAFNVIAQMSTASPVDMSDGVPAWLDSYYWQCAREGLVRDPKGPGHGRTHVLRGGGWPVRNAQAASSTARMPLPIFDRDPFDGDDVVGVRQAAGFRVLRELRDSN